MINPKTFPGDAAFDTVALYKTLLTGDTFGNNKHFTKAFIPLNARSGLENQDYTINEDGIPCCPHDAFCDDPLALLQNVDEWFTFILKNLRAYPGTVRGTEEWNKTYKLIIFSIIHSCLIGFLGKTY